MQYYAVLLLSFHEMTDKSKVTWNHSSHTYIQVQPTPSSHSQVSRKVVLPEGIEAIIWYMQGDNHLLPCNTQSLFWRTKFPSAQKAHLTRTHWASVTQSPTYSIHVPALFSLNSYVTIAADKVVIEPSPKKTPTENILCYYQNIKNDRKSSTGMNYFWV